MFKNFQNNPMIYSHDQICNGIHGGEGTFNKIHENYYTSVWNVSTTFEQFNTQKRVHDQDQASDVILRIVNYISKLCVTEHMGFESLLLWKMLQIMQSILIHLVGYVAIKIDQNIICYLLPLYSYTLSQTLSCDNKSYIYIITPVLINMLLNDRIM